MNLFAFKILPEAKLNPDCITCTPPEHDDRIIAFTDLFKVILHPDQTSIGSVIIASRRHVGRICDLYENELREFGEIILVFEPALENAFGAELINIYYQRNWAYRSDNPDPPFRNGKPSPHVHMHVIPRYSGKITFEEEEWIDPEFGEPFVYRSREVNRILMEKIIQQIQTQLTLKYK